MATWQDEQRVRVALRTKAPMSAADRRVAQDLTDRADRRRHLPWLYVGAAVLAFVLWAAWPAHPVWLVAVAVVILLVALWSWLFRVRRPAAQAAAVGLVPRRLRTGAASGATDSSPGSKTRR